MQHYHAHVSGYPLNVILILFSCAGSLQWENEAMLQAGQLNNDLKSEVLQF